MSRLNDWLRNRFHKPLPVCQSPPILLLHIPKTAGTSLRRMLQDEFGQQGVYPSDKDIRRRKDGLYPSEGEILREYGSLRRHRVLTGHFFGSFAERLPVRHRVSVFVRDPFQRALSILAHHNHVSGVPVERLLDDGDFVEGYVRNAQTRILGSADGTYDKHDSTTLLRRAVDRLDTFDFVGITERFTDSCRLFDSIFGTSIAKRVRRENVFRPCGNEHSDLIPRIEPLVELDRVLYARAVERFERDFAGLASAVGTVLPKAA